MNKPPHGGLFFIDFINFTYRTIIIAIETPTHFTKPPCINTDYKI